MQELRSFAILTSALSGLVTHHFGMKLSDVGLSPGEQDQLLQAHSAARPCKTSLMAQVGLGYVRPWLIISKRNGNLLRLGNGTCSGST